jgi:hypothetical protein
MVLLLAASAATGCAEALSTTRRHEIGGGLGIIASDEPAQDAVWTMNDAAAWTANYAFRLCDRCETFRLHVDIPLVAIPHQDVLTSSLAVPDARRDVYIIPNARFSIRLFKSMAIFTGFGGGVGHFAESGRLTTGEANPKLEHSTRAVFGVHPGLEGQVTEAFGIRFGLWIVGPRAALSVPERRGPDCLTDCGDVAFSYLFSVVYHF